MSDNHRQNLKRESAAAGKFALVGILATLTHAAVATGLLQSGTLPAFPANICGFLVAFGVSFSGHYFWSFAHLRQQGKALKSMTRFLVIALSGFALNSFVLALWLELTPWPDLFGLLVSIAIVPALSFLGARLWAFSHHPAET
ncbi:GtrA family protein [Roseibium sediminicola]|uniref:GtrA family protein n=1 Tax=Roseibium sediminicola TaxID=2933272 RepID=A0ABT0GSU3_9HYPH|nr:GtrA family protein [Roseibium sp. CAU 1639]MCK7612516.1 GtrA family protein [Roseibium sp. CAU 1639]